MIERLRAELTNFVRAAAARLDFVALYPATVRAQRADGTLDLEPDAGSRLPAPVAVPIRHGLPGVTDVRVTAGARVRVGFDAGDPARPFAVLWDAGNATSVTFNASAKQLARTDDTTAGGKLVFSPAGTFVGYVPPGGVDVPTPPGGSAVTLAGVINGSSMIRG